MENNFFYLTYEFSKREILTSYKGSLLGIWWSFVTPAIMMVIFIFVFGYIFPTKLQNTNSNLAEFGVNLFAGLIIFWFFAEIITKSSTAISSRPNLVKKVVFPLQILPISIVIVAIFNLMINILILTVATLLIYGKLHESIFAVLLVIVAILPALIGVSISLASIGVYIKDVSNITSIVVSALMFLSPIFYSLSAIRGDIKIFFLINPICLPIEWIRGGVINGIWPGALEYVAYLFLSMAICFLGYKTFKFMQSGFADVV